MHDVHELKRDVSEVKLAVSGDSDLGVKGLAKRVNMLELWRDRINLRVAYASGAGAAIVLGVKAGIEYLIQHK